MLIVGILLGLVLGLLAGGRLSNLGTIQLRWIPVLFAAVIIRFGTEAFLNAGVPIAELKKDPPKPAPLPVAAATPEAAIGHESPPKPGLAFGGA